MEQLPCPAIHGAAVSCLLLKSIPWPKGFQCDLALQGAIPNPRSNSCPGWRRRLPSRAVWAVGKEVSLAQPSLPGAMGRSGGCSRQSLAGSGATSAAPAVSPAGITVH